MKCMTRRVIDDFGECLQKCVDNNGSHLTDLIFKLHKNNGIMYFLKIKTFLLLKFVWLLLKLQMCQIFLPDPVYVHGN